MLAELRLQIAEIKRVAGQLDASLLHPRDAVALLDVFVEGERICAAGKTLVAARAEDSGEWSRLGYRSAASWLAAEAGTTVGAAAATLVTSDRLEDLPGLDAALRDGKVSQAQADVIAPVASVATEARLLHAAKSATMRELKETAARAKAASLPQDAAEARYEAVRRSRYLRHWSDADGAFCFEGRTTPEAGAALAARLDVERERRFMAARSCGDHEAYEAYAVDALVGLVTGEAPAAPRALVNLRIDESGDATVGGVPVPASVARELIADSVLKVLLTNGTDITAVGSTTRTIPTAVRTAVLERAGRACEVIGCDMTTGLELHHVVAFARAVRPARPTWYWPAGTTTG